MAKMPAIVLGPMREEQSKVRGLRDNSLERESGDARAVGPKRAARLWSPTREIKQLSINRRLV